MSKKFQWQYLVVLAGCVLAVVLGLQSHQSNLPSGAVKASGSAAGFNGDITVEVTASQDQIYAVTVTANTETEGIGSKAIEQLPSAIVEQQKINVDGVSGATFSSNGIKEAVKAALSSAGIDPSAFEK